MDRKKSNMGHYWDRIAFTFVRLCLDFIPSLFILSVFMGFGPCLRCCLISFSIQHLEVIDLGNIHFYDIRYFEPFRSVMLSMYTMPC